MSDVFSSLVGQVGVVNALRRYAEQPSHAYLFTGPPGAGKLEAAVAFAAALECPDHGCGTCDECARVLRGSHPDVSIVARAGVQWSVDEIREAERVARRRPLHQSHQILILPSIELSTNAAPALLKTLEEPPRRTIFILLADELPEHLVTIESRCVEVNFHSLSTEDILLVLEREGVPAVQARTSAEASAGNLDRARLLANDPQLADRLAAWRRLPEMLTSNSPASLATSTLAALEGAVEPLKARHAEELDQFKTEAEGPGRRRVGGVKEVELRHQREQRRFRTDELRFGLAALTRTYRERMISSLEGVADGDARGRTDARSAIACIEAIASSSDALSLNANESLLLTNLFTQLSRL